MKRRLTTVMNFAHVHVLALVPLVCLLPACAATPEGPADPVVVDSAHYTVIATPSRVTGSVPVPGVAALNSTRMTSALADPTFSGLCVSAGV